jgi:hypothetical protein
VQHRVLRIEPRSALRFGLVAGGAIAVLDLVLMALLWAGLYLFGFFQLLGGLAREAGAGTTLSAVVPPLLLIALGIALALVHGFATALLIWLMGMAFNATSALWGGIVVHTEEPLEEQESRLTQLRLRRDEHRRFGGARRAGVASPTPLRSVYRSRGSNMGL